MILGSLGQAGKGRQWPLKVTSRPVVVVVGGGGGAQACCPPELSPGLTNSLWIRQS